MAVTVLDGMDVRLPVGEIHCDRPNQRALVKGLFERAEKAGDDEAMWHFMVAFDRLVRRRLIEVKPYDWTTRRAHSEFVLRNDPTVAGRVPKSKKERRARNPQTGEVISGRFKTPGIDHGLLRGEYRRFFVGRGHSTHVWVWRRRERVVRSWS